MHNLTIPKKNKSLVPAILMPSGQETECTYCTPLDPLGGHCQ